MVIYEMVSNNDVTLQNMKNEMASNERTPQHREGTQHDNKQDSVHGQNERVLL
jgi:hypothetical protein